MVALSGKEEEAPAAKYLAETILPLQEVEGKSGPVSQAPEK